MGHGHSHNKSDNKFDFFTWASGLGEILNLVTIWFWATTIFQMIYQEEPASEYFEYGYGAMLSALGIAMATTMGEIYCHTNLNQRGQEHELNDAAVTDMLKDDYALLKKSLQDKGFQQTEINQLVSTPVSTNNGDGNTDENTPFFEANLPKTIRLGWDQRIALLLDYLGHTGEAASNLSFATSLFFLKFNHMQQAGLQAGAAFAGLLFSVADVRTCMQALIKSNDRHHGVPITQSLAKDKPGNPLWTYLSLAGDAIGFFSNAYWTGTLFQLASDYDPLTDSIPLSLHAIIFGCLMSIGMTISESYTSFYLNKSNEQTEQFTLKELKAFIQANPQTIKNTLINLHHENQEVINQINTDERLKQTSIDKSSLLPARLPITKLQYASLAFLWLARTSDVGGAVGLMADLAAGNKLSRGARGVIYGVGGVLGLLTTFADVRTRERTLPECKNTPLTCCRRQRTIIG